MYIIEPLINSLILGSFTILIGHLLDVNISRSTFKNEYVNKNKIDLYLDGQKQVHFNLLVVSPINYILAYNYLMCHYSINLCYNKLLGILITQNICYFLLHKLVHNLKVIKPIHDFHHKFIVNIPSIGNSVSFLEFQFMYVTPFLLGMFLFSPNVITVNISILIISIMNSIIHCNELTNFIWLPMFVSPKDHSNHHKTSSSTYSAPLLKLDLLFGKRN